MDTHNLLVIQMIINLAFVNNIMTFCETMLRRGEGVVKGGVYLIQMIFHYIFHL